MSRVIVTGPEVVEFVRRVTGATEQAFIDGTGLGVSDGEKIIGGVVYENYTGVGGCVEAHIAGEGARWMTARFLQMMFFYPFVQLGCKVLRGRVPSDNIKALNFDLKLGFKLEHLLRDATPKGDQWLIAMWREDCRFLEIGHGLEVRRTEA